MNKRVDNDFNSTLKSLPLSIEKQRGYIQKRIKTSRVRRNEKTKINTSLQDIRDLAATLYLTEIPGLSGIEQDRDILIDEYYEPIYLTD